VRDSAFRGVVNDRKRRESPPEKQNTHKTKFMKKINQFLFAAVIATTISLANNASAQYKATGDDGITASPKVRQMLNERKASAAASSITSGNQASTTVAANDGIVASPKLRQQLNEQKRNSVVTSSSTAVASTGHAATGADGLTASPKLPQQLNERPATIMIAPVK